MLASETFSTEHVDYIQRNGFSPEGLSTDPPLTSASFQLRRLFHIHGIGRLEKVIRPAPGQPLRLVSEEMLIGVYGHRVPLAFLISGTPLGVAIHLGTWATDELSLNSREQILHT